MFQENLSDTQRTVVQELTRACDEAGATAFTYTGGVGQDGTVVVENGDSRVTVRSVDLRRLQRLGYITLEWSGQFKATGTVRPRAFRAARKNFGRNVAVFIYDCARVGLRKLSR